MNLSIINQSVCQFVNQSVNQYFAELHFHQKLKIHYIKAESA